MLDSSNSYNEIRPSVFDIHFLSHKKNPASPFQSPEDFFFTKLIGTPNSVFGVVVRPRAGWSVVRIPVKERYFSFTKHPNGFWC